MRPHDLPTAEQLGRNKPHGHKMRYMAGCRCQRCRRGNALYERKLAEDRRRYGPNDLVPVDRVRAFLLEMQKRGIGYKTIAKTVAVARTGLGQILWPGKESKHCIRRRSEAKVLAYVPTLDTLPRSASIPAEETVLRVRQLEQWGYPRVLINRDALGNAAPGLQIHAVRGTGKFVVMVKTAIGIRDFFEQVLAVREFWQEKRGPIPPRHYVYWKDEASGPISIRSFELRPWAVAHDFHYVFPPALKQVIQLTGALKRKIRTRERKDNGKEHIAGPAGSPVRDAGIAV